jgi:hypothetical protein
MSTASSSRETQLQVELRNALMHADHEVTEAIARALERNQERLLGGGWGANDGDGCLLTLAAQELGQADGEALLRSSVAAVRIPALFDELWFLILTRTGDARMARSVTHRLVCEALVRTGPQAATSDGAAGADADGPVTARSAREK